MKRLFIFGTQNFAEMAHYLFTSDSDYTVAGFTVDGEYQKESTFHGLPVIAYEDFRQDYSPEDTELFVAIGVDRINAARAEKTEQLQREGYRLASFISSSASVPRDLTIGPNSMIMDQVNIHPFVTVGSNSIIWSSSRIALKSRIGNHAWITSAVIGDSAQIGDYSFVGLNATIAPFVNVGTHNLIGAGAVILQDTKDYAVYRGPRSRPSDVTSDRIANIRIIH